MTLGDARLHHRPLTSPRLDLPDLFSGRVRSSEQIQGQAAVKYPELDPNTEEVLGRAGIDFENCLSNMLLELTWSDWYND